MRIAAGPSTCFHRPEAGRSQRHLSATRPTAGGQLAIVSPRRPIWRHTVSIRRSITWTGGAGGSCSIGLGAGFALGFVAFVGAGLRGISDPFVWSVDLVGPVWHFARLLRRRPVLNKLPVRFRDLCNVPVGGFVCSVYLGSAVVFGVKIEHDRHE